MGNNLSIEEKIYKSAKDGDTAQLQAIIQQLHRQGVQVPRYLNTEDQSGQTPLIVAAARGSYACVDLLLRHDANLHHFTPRPEGTTALHECVQRGHLHVAELLLQYGANPFIENARGLTSVDIAINKGHVAMVRSLELRSHFTGTLQMKVPKFMGLGQEWKPRWCVIMPRYQFPSSNVPRAERVARSLLVCYKAAGECLPVCKVWLDGAHARSVIGSKGSGVLQCALSLHINHAPATGAHMTGDNTVGYTMHLRPPDGTAQGTEALQRFMEIINSSRRGAASQPRPGPTAASSQQQLRPAPPQAGPSTGRRPASTSHQPSESDEDIARKLQQRYDAEMQEYLRHHPEAAKASRLATSTSSPSSPAAPPQVNPPPAVHSPSGSTLNSLPSAPLYPIIDPTVRTTNLMDLPHTAPPSLGSGHSTANAPANGSPEWCRTNLPVAAAPPQSAAVPPPQPHPQQVTGVAAVDDDDEAGQCVICLAARATAGFLHGDSVHKCCCRNCALDLKNARVPTCPMCREPIDQVIMNVY